MTYVHASCRCGASGYLAPTEAGCADAPPSIFALVPDADAAPVAPPPRVYGVAVHEASHATVGHLLGFEIARVSIDWQPSVSWVGMSATRALDRTAVALAGDHGARLILHRHEFRPLDVDVIASFAAVRALAIGGCDRCVAALSCFAAEGADADDVTLLTAYRHAEAATIAVLHQPRIARAVRILAGLLMINGSMAGRVVHDALSAIGLAFSSLQIETPLEN